MLSTRLWKLLRISMIALPLGACGTSGVRNAAGLKLALGDDLGGAQGKTLTDQNKIDRNMARGCAIGVYSAAACDRHTKASAERRAELK
jgi:hypothetical protein